MNLSVCHLLRRNLSKTVNLQIANYSRKRNATGSNGTYKIVKSESRNDDGGSLNQGDNTNWELFATNGYPFYMPGNTGPSWQNTETSESTIQVPLIAGLTKGSSIKELKSNDSNEAKDKTQKNFDCIVQDCPMVLRRGIHELFPGRDLKSSNITVVTLIQKPNIKQLKKDKESETEKLAKSFVLAAQDICMTLTVMGYWADFINPFSGKPYLSPFHSNTLYDTDERFRCLDFEIIHKHNCVVIANENWNQSSRTFVASLFTNAPHNIGYLKDIKHHLIRNRNMY